MADHDRGEEEAVLTFEGDLNPQSFVEFAAHRSARLSLSHQVATAGRSRVEIAVRGPAVLVDAFEMALSLGPSDCIVRDVHRRKGVVA